MPSPLNASDQNDFWTDYSTQLLGVVPIQGSVVVQWVDNAGNTRWILVYHSADDNWYETDITDMPPATIQALATQSVAHGPLYYLPGAVVDTITADLANLPENAANFAQQVAAAAGNAVNAAVSPTLGSLSPIVIVVGVLALLFLFKKGGI